MWYIPVYTTRLKDAHVDTLHTSLGKVKVLSKHDLINMKKASGRPQDIEDVKALEEL